MTSPIQGKTNVIPDSATNLEFRRQHSGPSSAIWRQYGSLHDHSNLDHSEPSKFQVDDRVRYMQRILPQLKQKASPN